MIDLSELDVRAVAEAARDLPLVYFPGHPEAGKETGVVLQVLGYDAQPVVDAVRALERKYAAMDKAEKPTVSEYMDMSRVESAKAALVGWSGFTWNGEEKPFTEQFAAEILENPGFSWIVDQIYNFGKDRANLFPKPPKA